jgi:hypothetical protein
VPSTLNLFRGGDVGFIDEIGAVQKRDSARRRVSTPPGPTDASGDRQTKEWPYGPESPVPGQKVDADDEETNDHQCRDAAIAELAVFDTSQRANQGKDEQGPLRPKNARSGQQIHGDEPGSDNGKHSEPGEEAPAVIGNGVSRRR